MRKLQRKVESKADTDQILYTVDVQERGISLGRNSFSSEDDFRHAFSLKHAPDEAGTQQLRSRYILSKQNPLHQLERHMMLLSERGILRQSTVVLGVEHDPFLPFNGKFEKSMQFLELCKRYTPGLLHVQTRSPLIVIALPVLAKLGKHCSIGIGLETPCEESAQRYTPDLPRVSERIKTIRALGRFGISTHVQVSPVLPYGDWRKSAKEFAEMLVDISPNIVVKPLSDGSKSTEMKLRQTPLGKRLAEDRKFHYLRPDAALPLLASLEEIAPEALIYKRPDHLKAQQLDLFAA